MRSTRGWWSATSCLVSFDYDALQKIRLGQVFDEIADPSGRAKTFHSCGRLARTEVNMLECTPERLRAHPASMRAWLTLELARDATTAAQRQDRIVLAPRAERCISCRREETAAEKRQAAKSARVKAAASKKQSAEDKKRLEKAVQWEKAPEHASALESGTLCLAATDQEHKKRKADERSRLKRKRANLKLKQEEDEEASKGLGLLGFRV